MLLILQGLIFDVNCFKPNEVSGKESLRSEIYVAETLWWGKGKLNDTGAAPTSCIVGRSFHVSGRISRLLDRKMNKV